MRAIRFKAMYQRLNQLALQPIERQRPARQQLEQWLNRQTELPDRPPPDGAAESNSASSNGWASPPVNRVAEHPWGTLAELICGSHRGRQQSTNCISGKHGFVPQTSWSEFRSSPGLHPGGRTLEVAEPWIASGARRRPESVAMHAWAQHCPIEKAVKAHRWPFLLAMVQTSPVALNLMDVCSGL